jgi:hypothetical protein
VRRRASEDPRVIRIKPIKLRVWFPPDNPVAAAVARLCVLREDLFIELHGIIEERFEHLDANLSEFRRLYFWRNSLRTLKEIRDSLNQVNAEKRFRDALASETEGTRVAFKSLKKELNKTSEDMLVELRNTIGAHLDRGAMQDALNDMDPRREGLIELGEIRGKIHYKFAGELLIAILLRNVPDDQQEQKFEEILGKTASLSRALAAIDDVVACYARDRDLRA